MKKTVTLFILSVFNLIFYFSMRSFWSGIENMFKVSWLAYFIFAILVIIVLASIILRRWKSKIVTLILLVLSVILTIAFVYMFYLGLGSIRYVFRTFIDGVIYLAFTLFVYYMIFYYPKSKLSNYVAFKLSLFILIIIFLSIIVFNLRINYITNMPVVFAVEDEYQIVWTTNADSTASVTVGNNTYYDLYAGSEKSETKVHKVLVPMAELDQAKEYTISSTAIIYRGPYSGVKGRTVSKTIEFIPVNLEDGLNYYCLSDTHEFSYAGSKTGSYFGDDLDFLVMIGDISSHLENPSDIEIINTIAFNITHGQKPVVYARGNHETKAYDAQNLYQYVGSKDQKFYYTFNLSGIFGVVLDLGEDHNDDWWEFYGTSHFETYRNEQTEFLNKVVAAKDYEDASVKYRMAICHMPVTYVGSDNFLKDVKESWTSLLNQMNLDIMVNGHTHQLMQFTLDMNANETLYYDSSYSSNTTTPRGYRTDSNFNAFVVSRRNNDQNSSENLSGRKFIGLAVSVDFNAKKQNVKYTNTLGEVVEVVNPFTGAKFTEYEFNLGE